MSKGKIIISGDSWGCGEWQEHPFCIIHTGLQFYLEEAGYRVVNVSDGGMSNTESTIALNNKISIFAPDYFDYIFWFQTDPLRCLRPYNENVFNNEVKIEHLLDKCSTLCDKTYDCLNKLNKKIYCIGGCYPLQDSIHQYNNLIPIIPSVIKLCYPNFNLPELWFSDWLDKITKNYVDLERFVSIKRQQDSLGKKEYEEYFKPDGRHANRKAHKLIFDALDKQLQLT